MTNIILFTKDLFFIAKVKEIAKQSGAEVTVVRAEGVLTEILTTLNSDTLFLIDLEKAGIELEYLSSALRPYLNEGCRCLSFFSHVHQEVSEKAHMLGLGEVMARSKFVRVLPEILSKERIP